MIFDDLIKETEYYDILYSEKVGYVQLYIEEKFGDTTYTVLDDFESVARALFNEVIDTVRDLQLCGEHDNVDLYPEEKAEVYNRIMQYINRAKNIAAPCLSIWEKMQQELRQA